MNRSNIFIGLVIFYTIFIGFVAIDSADITTSEDDSSSFISFIETYLPFLGDFANYVSIMFTTVSGYPTIVHTILFVPMIIMLVWFIVDFVVWIVPFIGGGS